MKKFVFFTMMFIAPFAALAQTHILTNNPTAQATWFQHLHNASSQPVNVNMFEDSFSRCDLNNCVQGPAQGFRVPDILRAQLQARYGSHGTGIVPVYFLVYHDVDPDNYTISGTHDFSVSALGPTMVVSGTTFNTLLHMASGTTLTFTSNIAFDTLQIYYATSGASGDIAIVADGTTSLGTANASTTTATGYSNGGYTAQRFQGSVVLPNAIHRITLTASGDVYFYGAQGTSGTAGVEVSNISVGGFVSQAFGNNVAAENAFADLNVTPTYLATFMGEVNEAGYSVAPSSMNTYVSALIAHEKGLSSAPSFVIDIGPVDIVNNTTPLAPYTAVLQNLCATLAIECVNTQDRWGTTYIPSYLWDNTAVAPGIHFSAAGALDIESMLYEKIVDEAAIQGIVSPPATPPATTTVIGNASLYSPNADTSPGVAIAHPTPLAAGTLTSFQLNFSDNQSATPLHIYIFNQSGSALTVANTFTVTPPTSTGVHTFSAGTDFTAVSVAAGQLIGYYTPNAGPSYNNSNVGTSQNFYYYTGEPSGTTTFTVSTAAAGYLDMAATITTPPPAANLSGTTQYSIPYQTASATTGYLAPCGPAIGTYVVAQSVTSTGMYVAPICLNQTALSPTLAGDVTGSAGANTVVAVHATSGTLDGVTIGGTTPAASTFTGMSLTNAGNSVQATTTIAAGANTNWNLPAHDPTSEKDLMTLTGYGISGIVVYDTANGSTNSLVEYNGRFVLEPSNVETTDFSPTLTTMYVPLKLPVTISSGTQSVSGCSVTSATGGASAGAFNSGTTGTCTVTITPGITAPNGFRCDGTDLTTATDHLFQSAFTTTTCTIKGTTVSSDSVTWSVIAF